ncbi:MAG TPA: CDP-alcohol phosphatidyltransferase family protein [Kofleriaceae bacterium]|nr:CDP-alcohol phosphatidyltransferase family protein [Kofleriaceae bacterium]
MNDYVNPANAVTASRYLTLPAFVYWLDNGDYQLAAIAVVVCGVLDLFDGAVARAFHCTSGFGELLDAVTDALCYGFFTVVLAVYGKLPWVPVIAIIALGTLNTALRAIYARRLGRASNYRSYAMERVVALAAYLSGFGVTGFEPAYFAWTCAALMAVIIAHDAKRMVLDPVPAAPAGREEAAA